MNWLLTIPIASLYSDGRMPKTNRHVTCKRRVLLRTQFGQGDKTSPLNETTEPQTSSLYTTTLAQNITNICCCVVSLGDSPRSVGEIMPICFAVRVLAGETILDVQAWSEKLY